MENSCKLCSSSRGCVRLLSGGFLHAWEERSLKPGPADLCAAVTQRRRLIVPQSTPCTPSQAAGRAASCLPHIINLHGGHAPTHTPDPPSSHDHNTLCLFIYVYERAAYVSHVTTSLARMFLMSSHVDTTPALKTRTSVSMKSVLLDKLQKWSCFLLFYKIWTKKLVTN